MADSVITPVVVSVHGVDVMLSVGCSDASDANVMPPRAKHCWPRLHVTVDVPLAAVMNVVGTLGSSTRADSLAATACWS